MTMARTMTETRRAFLALKGEGSFPVRGQLARWNGALVKVVGLSSGGGVVWVRFLSKKRTLRHRQYLHRFERVQASDLRHAFGVYVGRSGELLDFNVVKS